MCFEVTKRVYKNCQEENKNYEELFGDALIIKPM